MRLKLSLSENGVEVIIALAVFAASIIIFGSLSIVTHEYGHGLAALALGVNPGDMEIVLFAIPPHITIPDNSFPESYLPYYRFTGGFIGCLSLVGIYIVIVKTWWQKRQYHPLHMSSVAGFTALLLGATELYQAYWEAFHFGRYVNLEHFNLPWIALPMLAAVVIHFFVRTTRRGMKNY